MPEMLNYARLCYISLNYASLWIFLMPNASKSTQRPYTAGVPTGFASFYMGKRVNFDFFSSYLSHYNSDFFLCKPEF